MVLKAGQILSNSPWMPLHETCYDECPQCGYETEHPVAENEEGEKRSTCIECGSTFEVIEE